MKWRKYETHIIWGKWETLKIHQIDLMSTNFHQSDLVEEITAFQ